MLCRIYICFALTLRVNNAALLHIVTPWSVNFLHLKNLFQFGEILTSDVVRAYLFDRGDFARDTEQPRLPQNTVSVEIGHTQNDQGIHYSLREGV